MHRFATRIACCLFLGGMLAASGHSSGDSGAVEPNAGSWKTWVISSAKDFRLPPPPGAAETETELKTLHSLVNQAGDREQIRFWDAGAPSYRWIDLIWNRILQGKPVTPYPHRIYTYVALAMYDATIASWDSKYAFNRPRPAHADPKLRPALPTPCSPSYPSEHAATAGAAAAVLAYFFPEEASSFQALAQEAAESRVKAGVQFPSDSTAGLEPGRRVAEAVIERAKADGSDAVWTGTVPTGPCLWTGTNPGNVTAANWRPFLLSAPNEFRPAPPTPCDSAEFASETAAVRDFTRTFATNWKAFYWQSPEGLNMWPYVYANKWIFEDRLDKNAPRVARAYALLAASLFDAFIASQDGKFAYWFIRPPQLDASIVPLFPVPNFPSYPSNHAVFSAARSEILAYLFPSRADLIRAVAVEAAESRVWAGIHFPMDAVSGLKLGKSVAQKFMAWASADGSQ